VQAATALRNLQGERDVLDMLENIDKPEELYNPGNRGDGRNLLCYAECSMRASLLLSLLS
jgi:hypothetical protein